LQPRDEAEMLARIIL